MNAVLSSLVWTVSLLSPAEPPQPARTGKVLVLENENVLVGEIERLGDQYRVRRSLGETWVPANHALCLCSDMEAAYAFIRGRANLHDPDERLRLARWCRGNGLLAQAITEAKAALTLRPDHPESRRLLALLELAAEAPPSVPVPPPAPEKPTPGVDLTAECLGMFVTKVQPVLMNTCANCHTTAHPGPFRLTRAYEGLSTGKALQQNLAVVLAQVNFAQPQTSPLLTKAVSDHAHNGQAPLRGRQMAAYRTLEDWVRLTLENNPQLHEPQPPPPATPMGRAESTWGQEHTPPPPKPAAKVSGTPDPYDPEDFNRLAHPEKPRRP
jgi:hypothetical protein